MKKLPDLFFSMKSMGILILIFAFSIGTATFIEKDFGTPAAKALVYNATWFNILLALLAANLVGNIFRYHMYRRGKFTIFLFHAAFLVILLGAAITRFTGFEGILHLREGQTSNTILSDQTYVEVHVINGRQVVQTKKPVLLSVLTPRAYHQKIKAGNKNLELKAVKFIPNAREVITEGTGNNPIITLVVATSAMNRTNIYLKMGEEKQVGKYLIKFGDVFDPKAVNILYNNNTLSIKANDTIHSGSMQGGPPEVLNPGRKYPFTKGRLYRIHGLGIVMTNFFAKGKIDYVPYRKNAYLMDVLVVKATSGNKSKEIILKGGQGYVGEQKYFTINGLHVEMDYGSSDIKLPFSIKLKKFELKRYPGSRSPSSYASRVEIIDKEKNIDMPYHIYMNHVLNYRGYRFFQSSYDRDEHGSILSVNHDYWGTFFTYFGYLLMAIGMFLSLLNRNSYFSTLGKHLRKTTTITGKAALLLLLFTVILSGSAYARQKSIPFHQIPKINKTEAARFGHLLVQSNDGRIKPVNTLASEILRKLTWKTTFHGQTADQVLLGMMTYPSYWERAPLIKVSSEKLAKIIGIRGKYASYLDFIDTQNNTYKLQRYVSQAYSKEPSHRERFDHVVMKVDERMNIAYMVFTGQIMKMIPDTRNPNHAWYSPASNPAAMSQKDSLMVADVFPEYLKALANGNKKLAHVLLTGIARYQQKYGAAIIPSREKINAEILYNKWMIFFRLAIFYSIIGLVMILLTFVAIFKDTKFIRILLNIFVGLIAVGFIFQTFGLGLRWYISGHAPWSDGYESMIYIGWVTVLAGLFFSRRSKMTVAATTFLASIILFVAHLSWMDPEITNLVPVLKSYWLTIHVSVITASYGFLALGALLGFLNLILMIMKSPKNHFIMDGHIKELTIINERTLIVGLYMLAIGTFLGGVWANESWGRYWSWDPKETWALISILVYSFIVHMRFIPGLKSRFAFNLASLLGFFSILMTYFGVNYYLSGLHSYAKGTPVPIPDFVYYMLGVIILIVIWAYNNETRLRQRQQKKFD